MASILESQAYFKSRLANLKLAEFEKKFIDRDWTTMASFAFAANYVPGRSDETILVEKVFKKIFGLAPDTPYVDHPKEHAVRRLFFEAHTLVAHDITRRLSHPDEEGKAPRKLPLEERGERMKH